jgi:TPR repeat protein
MASVYVNGEIIVKNYEVAFGLFKRAALLGHVTAHREMGNMLFLGRGTKEDVDSAKHHWEIAAKKGDYFARYSRAIEETNSIKRFRHLSISASQGHKESM